MHCTDLVPDSPYMWCVIQSGQVLVTCYHTTYAITHCIPCDRDIVRCITTLFEHHMPCVIQPSWYCLYHMWYNQVGPLWQYYDISFAMCNIWLAYMVGWVPHDLFYSPVKFDGSQYMCHSSPSWASHSSPSWASYGMNMQRVHINIDFIDLRSAQVYCVAIFLVSQEVSLNFHRFCG